MCVWCVCVCACVCVNEVYTRWRLFGGGNTRTNNIYYSGNYVRGFSDVNRCVEFARPVTRRLGCVMPRTMRVHPAWRLHKSLPLSHSSSQTPVTRHRAGLPKSHFLTPSSRTNALGDIATRRRLRRELPMNISHARYSPP